ncbi:uncharacterized protein ACHE_60116A [Aspergillus chevalieri]|uniref:Amino acid transporter transmembrane domain-containing protein n=1 Tax=Aspergillus chevalieri TaxID=182096 RepID=A0A7R7ZPR4_ASPCH|nr:uncharacterized protein ACHE_60116A [Aspergillus chevalieri]BCR90230.1 hypothetical protein ACHE_60116A [Aspergillus chevalieri]
MSMTKVNVSKEDLEDPTVPSQAVTHDDVFGEISDRGPNYRNVRVLGIIALMMKTQIGLGVLSIPSAFNTSGIVS